MDNLHPRRYIFHGHATGVAAHIRRPQDQLLPVQGCSALPVIGGFAEHKVGKQQLGKWVSFDSVATSANGDYVNPADGVGTTTGTVAFDAAPTQTKVQCEVDNLAILSRVKVVRAAVGLTSHSPKAKEEPSITLEGNALEGVSIDDSRLTITLDEEFFRTNDTKGKLAQAYAKGLAAEQAAMLLPLDGSAPPPATFPEAGGTVKWTIVKKITWDGAPHPTATIHGHVVRVPNFGKIYFGELYVTAYSRRITMVRFQLGSDDGGEVIAADGETNGTNWPPD